MKSRIQKYIDKIQQIPEGERNGTLFRIGLSLRKVFGLTGNDLEVKLSEVNETKCEVPLRHKEIVQIARSVDKSNAHTERRFNKSHTLKQQIVFKVSVLEDSISVTDLLSKEVSCYPNCQAKTPGGKATIGGLLKAFRVGGKFLDLINTVRNEKDKDKRNKLKQSLPAVVLGSEPQTERKAKSCIPNGIIVIDFDNIPPDKLEEAIQAIAAIPYVFAVGLSVSGKGIFALAYYSGTPVLKKLLAAMQADFRYPIDMQCSDISRLRYATYDPDLIVKDKVFSAILTERIETTDGDITDYTPLQYVPFPIDCLPSTLAQFVKDAQSCIGLNDSAMPAISVLAVTAGVIGSSCQIEIKPGHIELAALFMVIVADSGTAKSPSIKIASRHLTAIQNEKIKQWKRAKNEWEQVYSDWKKLPPKDQGNQPPPPPPVERFIIKDITIEAVAAILEKNPLGVLLIRDEVNAFFVGMDAYRKSSTDLQSWIEIYEGEAIFVDRKMTEVIQVDRPSISIVGGIQTGILKKTFEKRRDFIDSGLGSRLLFVMPEKEPVVWNLNTPDEEITAKYENMINSILNDRKITLEKDESETDAFTKVDPIVFTLSKDARRVLFDFQERYARQAVYDDAANAAAKNKAGRIAARLCLVLHCVYSIEQTGYLHGLTEVSKETADNAVAIADWFVHEAERVYAMLAGEQIAGELTAIQQMVMFILQKHNKPMTINEIRDKTSRSKRPSVDDMEKTIHELEKLGKVQSNWRQHEGKGRHAMEYKISEQNL